MATSSLSTKMSYLNAKKFVDSITSYVMTDTAGDPILDTSGDPYTQSQSNLYVYIGRPQPWPNESVPPDANNSLETEYNVWHDMMAMKRVTSNDITLGFKKIDWVSGQVYDEYSHDVDLTQLNYYVCTNENKVYKCIDNASYAMTDTDGDPILDSSGDLIFDTVPSTVKPTHTTTTIVETSDGYKWKYMFTISDSLIRKFASGDYLPISSNEAVQSQVTLGSIDHIKLISGGGGYPLNASILNQTQLPVYVKGDGDENSTATCNIVAVGGAIQSIAIVNQGYGYPYASETNIPIMIRQITSTGAVENAYGTIATNSTGQVIIANIVLRGTNYITGPAIIVQSSCYGYAETSESGAVINVETTIARSGSNFRKASAIVVSPSTTLANVKPIISPFRGHGASPARELLARFALINLSFAYSEGAGDFTIQNDFRRIGLIDNPFEYGTTTVATARTLNAKNTLIVSNITGSFNEDTTIYGQTSGAKGLNVDLINGNELRYIRDDSVSNNIDFQLETISSASGATAVITAIQSPEVEPYSGDILFINNRIAIDRTSNQIETITLVLEY